MDVASWGKKGIGSVLAVGQTGAELFGEKILDSYVKTLDAIAKEGATQYISERMRPFLQAAAAHFHPEKKTWTESILGSSQKPQEEVEDQPSEPGGTEDSVSS